MAATLTHVSHALNGEGVVLCLEVVGNVRAVLDLNISKCRAKTVTLS